MAAFQFGPNADFTLQPGRYAWTADVGEAPQLPTRAQSCNGTLIAEKPLTAQEAAVEVLAWIRNATGWPTAALLHGSIWTI
ncbi:hypothetical protein [Streptomyces lavendulae]|uniref:hypothetical protein n=1 Tax=Streptomyces lavendulae TaxID=1914 RepID=UPI0033DC26D8